MRSLLRYPNLTFFFTEFKNVWKECVFWRKKLKKGNFYKNKKAFKIDNVDVNKMLVSKVESMVKKIHLNI